MTCGRAKTNMADKDDKWMKFKKALKEKRTGKQGKSKDPRRTKEEIVVQNLSVDVTGKAQKYSRIGPREFVQVRFDDDDLTIEKIKGACALCTTNRTQCSL